MRSKRLEIQRLPEVSGVTKMMLQRYGLTPAGLKGLWQEQPKYGRNLTLLHEQLAYALESGMKLYSLRIILGRYRAIRNIKEDIWMSAKAAKVARVRDTTTRCIP